ncbi:hypothetical protein [Microbacterium testaceum]|uniref:hypothetical protein n=1 Tax=Microbacterium testaceum TaxID=2033 RepID=UPI00380B6B51
MAKPIDPQQLSAPEFRLFITHFPDHYLRDSGLKGTTFFAVGMALAQFGDYATGERVRPTQKALADTARVDPRTVKEVLKVLVHSGALEETTPQRHAGSPSRTFRFRRSDFVSRVLVTQDRHWTPLQMNKTGVHPLPTGVHPLPDASTPNNKNRQNGKNCSVAEAPSPAPVVALSPDGASDGAVTPDEFISESWLDGDSEIDLLLAGV